MPYFRILVPVFSLRQFAVEKKEIFDEGQPWPMVIDYSLNKHMQSFPRAIVLGRVTTFTNDILEVRVIMIESFL